MILRDYQHKMVDDTRAALRAHRSVVIQSECGSGKGSICAYIINRAVERKKHVLFIVRGKDRVADMATRVTKLGIPHGVLMGGKKRERWHSVQIASIDTLHRMAHKPLAALICLDECHYALSPKFREVLACYETSKIIGMTATPALGNNKPLGVSAGGIFEAMVKGPSVTQLIREGYLVGSRVFAPPPPPEVNGIKKTKTGEFDGEEGAAICDNSKVIGDLVEHWKRHSSDRKTAVFGFNQKHAFHIAETFRAAGLSWAYVDANTPDGDIHTPGTRKFFWHQMEFGDLVGVASIGVISLGWDMPPCKSLILASKTASFPLYRQRLGRGSRPYKNYKEFLVFDHCNGLMEFQDKGAFFESEIDWQLDGDPIRLSEADKARRVATCKTPVEIPEMGIPPGFTGPTEGKWLLPCLRPYSPGPQRCPHCGIPIVTNSREIESEEGELREITPEMRVAAEEKLRSESKRKAWYLDLVKTARENNYKPGYPFVVFKSRYGYPPPKGWREEVEMILGKPQEVIGPVQLPVDFV